ncbi:ketoacyl-ACP synthase III [Vibrio sp. F74]|uniref:ketoacyl-ACP synthase III n=1 Tax=Vibrio sp. F74 TaxID=700020 RepID=UPI0035F53607
MSIYISAIASFIPENRIDNYSNALKFNKSADFVNNRIGITQLSVKNHECMTSDLATKAAEKLIHKTNIDIFDIDALVVVTQNGDSDGIPHTSAIVQNNLGLKTNLSAFDIGLGCSGYVYGLSILKAHMIDMGFKNAILITADPYSSILDKNDKNTSMIFGDGASATLLSERGVFSIGRPQLSTDGAGKDALYRNEKLVMDGRKVFSFVSKKVPIHIRKIIEDTSLDQIDLCLIHQGSLAIVDTIRKNLDMNNEMLPFKIQNYGNTVSSSIPIMLEGYLDEPKIKNIVISGFGVGLSWATNILKRVEKK